MVYYKPTALICLFLYAICCNNVASHNVPVYKHKGKYSHRVRRSNHDVVVPKKIDTDGNFVSYSLPHYYKRSVKNAHVDKVNYLLPLDGNDKHLELVPNRNIVAPGSLVESLNIEGDENLMNRFNDNQCQFIGRIKNERNTRAALSACNGLSGYIRTKNGQWFIEPLENFVDNQPQAHKLYQHSADIYDNDTDDTSNADMFESFDIPEDINQYIHRKNKNVTVGQKTRNIKNELHMETLVVLDHSIMQFHKDIDLENFVLTVFNIAHDLFHDKSLGVNINIVIVRIIRLDVEDHEMNIGSNKNPKKTMEYFRKWQKKVNPKDDVHPNHHDIAVLLTRIDICSDDKSCGLLGAARFAGMCDPLNSVIICQDNGLRMGFTIAHEIGHVLGIEHDKDISVPHIMNPYIDGTLWSPKSASQVKELLESGFGKCLYDLPSEHSFVLVDALPGVMYDADYQCREIFGSNAALCMTGLECKNLICYIEDKGCVETNMMPAEGTNCGDNKWCYNGDCVEAGERPKAVDGGWGIWSPWTECSRTCGSGVASQERQCNNPIPANGGKYCSGLQQRYRICSTEPCELGCPTFRDIQCAEFNSWVYPRDGRMHKWRSYPTHAENLCALYCVNELENVETLRPRVIDGTTCYRGIRDVCINGLCKEIPCDLHLESTAVEDRCGVCKGDGTSCDVIRGERAFYCTAHLGEKMMLDIPQGAINIKIEEMLPSESRVEIRDKSGTNTYLTGDALGMFEVVGTKAWVGMIRKKQEAISIPGPISQAVTIWVSVQQNSTVKYMYGVKTKHKRTPSFSWDYLDWSLCSAECGPGTEVAVPKCVEKEAGLVDESYCKGITRLPSQVRPCQITCCGTKWYIGDWQECTMCPWGVRPRMVKCYRQFGIGEGELEFVSDSYCKGPKPKSTHSCVCKDNVKPIISKAELEDLRHINFVLSQRNATKNTTIVDFKDIHDMRLILHPEMQKYQLLKGHQKRLNETVIELEDVNAIKYINTVQQDVSYNRTRI